jgi:polyisoprenoid-binding protein YceI
MGGEEYAASGVSSKMRFVLYAVAVVALGCAPEIQRAAVSPAPVELPRVALAPRGAKRFVVRPSHSRLLVRAVHAYTGKHVLTFDRWRAILVTEPSLEIFVDADMTSVRTSVSDVESYVRYDLLEIGQHPHATLLATLHPVLGGEPGEHVAEGRMVLHGVAKDLRFHATVTKRAASYRFVTSFEISRKDFAIGTPDIWDGYLHDTVSVSIDADVTPERVEVEELPPGDIADE